MVHRIQASLDESSIKQVAQIADEFCSAPSPSAGSFWDASTLTTIFCAARKSFADKLAFPVQERH